MVQIIDENRRPSLSERFGRSFANASMTGSKVIPEMLLSKQQQLGEAQSQENENQAIQDLIGSNLSGVRDPKLRQILVERALQGQGEAQKILQQKNEKLMPLYGALDTVAEMKRLKQTGHLGPKISQLGGLGFLSPNVRRDRAKYEQLGKSLIQFSTNIPIRNQQEFQTLAEKLYDPTLTEAQIEGTLSAMEQIIQNSLKQYGNQEERQPSKEDENKVVVMKDKKGNVYDIPAKFFEQAKAKGLTEQ